MLRRIRPRHLQYARATPTSSSALHPRRQLASTIQYAEQGFFTPSSIPSSSKPSGSPGQGGRRRERISDEEYHLRIGRASDLLRATLSEFMRTGLVDYRDNKPGRSSALTLLDVFTFRALASREISAEGEDTTPDQVYDPKIHFQFRPAPPLSTSRIPSTFSGSSASPTDEEAASLSFTGRNLYFASAHVLRHTLNVLFSDPQVQVRKLRLESKGEKLRVEDALHVRMEFNGHLRVTGQEHNYTLIFRYDFDNDTGRIVRHTVERVEPAIGRKVSKRHLRSN